MKKPIIESTASNQVITCPTKLMTRCGRTLNKKCISISNEKVFLLS